jgi:dephospho-CoA kinase
MESIGMTKVIGITGMMGSGKTTLINKLKKLDQNNIFEYLNVDDFRRSIKELEILKPYIYEDSSKMTMYKNILYKRLKQYLSNLNKSIIVEWALIVEDDISDLFDLLIIVDCSKKEILRRLKKGDLKKSEINERLNRQMTTKEKQSHLKDKQYIIINEKYDEENLIELMRR